jgi:hypothetical protein
MADQTYIFLANAKSYSQKTRDLVLTLDIRPLLSLKMTSTQCRDFRDYENIITCQWFLRHITLFGRLRITIFSCLQMWDEGYMYDVDSEIPRQNTSLLLISTTDIPLLESNTLVTQNYARDVMYLDLSYTSRSEELPQTLSTCLYQNLRILKLRGLRLSKLPPFILDLGLQLWSWI